MDDKPTGSQATRPPGRQGASGQQNEEPECEKSPVNENVSLVRAIGPRISLSRDWRGRREGDCRKPNIIGWRIKREVRRLFDLGRDVRGNLF